MGKDLRLEVDIDSLFSRLLFPLFPLLFDAETAEQRFVEEEKKRKSKRIGRKVNCRK
jgi:hypothetical protein